MHKYLSLAFIAISFLYTINLDKAMAQATTTPFTPLVPGALSSPPNVAPPNGPLPPVGDGNIAPPEIVNDAMAPPADPSGVAQSNPVYGTNFPVGVGSGRTLVFIYDNGPRGIRLDQTIRPDQLSINAISQISAILGQNIESGQPYIQVVASDGQIAEINQVLAPYPNAIVANGRTTIINDSPAAKYPVPGTTNRYMFQGPLPTVATFGRYLVILGVVCATIFMALASYSIVSGSQYGGARVIGSAAGLILLLMAYTIWKVVQMNTFNPIASFLSQNVSRPTQALVPLSSYGGTNTPGLPATIPASPARSGVPLEPLGASYYP